MTTQKQIEANRRNSCKSTGPITRIGKAKSKIIVFGVAPAFTNLSRPLGSCTAIFESGQSSC